MKRVVTLFAVLSALALSASAQTISATTSSPVNGQTATASFTPVPVPLLTMGLSCAQQPPFQPVGVTKGTAFNCTLTASVTADSTTGPINITIADQPVWQITPSLGTPCVVTVPPATPVPCVVTIAVGSSSTTFSLLGR